MTEIAFILFDLNGVLYRYDRDVRIGYLSSVSNLSQDAVKAAIRDLGIEDTGDAGGSGYRQANPPLVEVRPCHSLAPQFVVVWPSQRPVMCRFLYDRWRQRFQGGPRTPFGTGRPPCWMPWRQTATPLFCGLQNRVRQTTSTFSLKDNRCSRWFYVGLGRSTNGSGNGA